ncbi:Nif-specific regulatory protein [mine drainage metagenome]|uniref:Nif-specific regulatory protein n=1 Tax=mine drainage metagenome TaxID=410659 RepID=A0A1J5RZB5_9ZZZZ
MKILVCWIGKYDLDAINSKEGQWDGPIAQAVGWGDFEQVVLLSSWDKAKSNQYVGWLKGRYLGRVLLRLQILSKPTAFGEIYQAVVAEVGALQEELGKNIELVFHLTGCTPAMSAVWIIAAKTRFPAQLIESSEQGVQSVSIPFDISADFIPDLMRRSDSKLEKMAEGRPDEAAQFKDILYRSNQMKRVVDHAKRIALRSIPVLIEGESGTGKELMARAIHHASPRRDKLFTPINCGAIPENLLESELFGHKKGSFTGAQSDHKGYFEQSDGGTIFLDEIGELPKSAQVKLLRVLQEKEVQRIGDSTPIKIDVRIISATNRSLIDEVKVGSFREDLFYRIAVAIVRLPALRDREGDMSMLVEHLLKKINEEVAREQPGFIQKTISATARNIILQHQWPGNVRELNNTLQRAVVWNDDSVIDEETIRNSILNLMTSNVPHDSVLDRSIDQGIQLQDILNEVGRHYIKRALDFAHGNKTKTASLLGLSNHQTLSGWMKRCGVD